ncbi:hypothetical protein D8674_023924 [Pyrus ussuriensis x Pyrus communis]|uniref:Uncharacterized protein n=1 Tax=Pyrus ussuriensis x Pyrus communis TaxID=2448454 RepID=A0A5N5H6K7_9ROSA|nr:hypothetical protein D8674_023924 [Pyrus ussuriensis x Pyrus communis]
MPQRKHCVSLVDATATAKAFGSASASGTSHLILTLQQQPEEQEEEGEGEGLVLIVVDLVLNRGNEIGLGGAGGAVKGGVAGGSYSGKRRWKGLVIGVLGLVFPSMLVPLLFLLGLHNGFHPSPLCHFVLLSSAAVFLNTWDLIPLTLPAYSPLLLLLIASCRFISLVAHYHRKQPQTNKSIFAISLRIAASLSLNASLSTNLNRSHTTNPSGRKTHEEILVVSQQLDSNIVLTHPQHQQISSSNPFRPLARLLSMATMEARPKAKPEPKEIEESSEPLLKYKPLAQLDKVCILSCAIPTSLVSYSML